MNTPLGFPPPPPVPEEIPPYIVERLLATLATSPSGDQMAADLAIWRAGPAPHVSSGIWNAATLQVSLNEFGPAITQTALCRWGRMCDTSFESRFQLEFTISGAGVNDLLRRSCEIRFGNVGTEHRLPAGSTIMSLLLHLCSRSRLSMLKVQMKGWQSEAYPTADTCLMVPVYCHDLRGVRRGLSNPAAVSERLGFFERYFVLYDRSTSAVTHLA
ncbi:unnamed protein product [Mycena citricolor]|uniref:Uncharacterized protein n=1 Tax=Mycena citricolor TaxID=2018698 RepID=A0AAD2Q552_9AGAR|nr:unnamed protein product [Mycena citricolor]